MHKISIEFTIILLKTLHSYMLRAVLFHHQGQLDDGPVRPAHMWEFNIFKNNIAN